MANEVAQSSDTRDFAPSLAGNHPQITVSSFRKLNDRQLLLFSKGIHAGFWQYCVSQPLSYWNGDLADLVDESPYPQAVSPFVIFWEVQRKEIIRICITVWMRDKTKLVQEVEVKVLSGEGSRNNQTQLFTGQFNCVQSGVVDWFSDDPQIKLSV